MNTETSIAEAEMPAAVLGARQSKFGWIPAMEGNARAALFSLPSDGLRERAGAAETRALHTAENGRVNWLRKDTPPRTTCLTPMIEGAIPTPVSPDHVAGALEIVGGGIDLGLVRPIGADLLPLPDVVLAAGRAKAPDSHGRSAQEVAFNGRSG